MCRDDPVYCYFVDYGTTEERTHNSVNEVTAIDTNNDADFLYDKNGNLTKWTDDPEGTPVVKEFLWDDLNRLTKIIVDSDDEAIFIYDVNNQRVRKEYDSDDDGDIDVNDETIEYVWSDSHVVEEYVDGSLDRNYVHGNSFIDELILFEDSSGDYHYYLQDFRYTVYALVDEEGTIEERYRFDPYGKRTVVADDGSIDEHYGFTGRYHDDSDDTDLIYFRNRWLSPEMGRFVSRDPLEYLDGMNLYSVYFVPDGIDPWGYVEVIPIDPDYSKHRKGYQEPKKEWKPEKRGFKTKYHRFFWGANRLRRAALDIFKQHRETVMMDLRIVCDQALEKKIEPRISPGECEGKLTEEENNDEIPISTSIFSYNVKKTHAETYITGTIGPRFGSTRYKYRYKGEVKFKAICKYEFIEQLCKCEGKIQDRKIINATRTSVGNITIILVEQLETKIDIGKTILEAGKQEVLKRGAKEAYERLK